MIVQVRGTCSLSKSIVERLLYLEAKVSTPLCNSLSKQHISLIKHTQAELMETDGDYVISLDNSLGDLVVGKDLIIHDMISDGFQSMWSSKVFHDWINGNTSLPRGTHWWVGQSDVADAIARLGLHAQKVENMHICGRRGWILRKLMTNLLTCGLEVNLANRDSLLLNFLNRNLRLTSGLNPSKTRRMKGQKSQIYMRLC